MKSHVMNMKTTRRNAEVYVMQTQCLGSWMKAAARAVVTLALSAGVAQAQTTCTYNNGSWTPQAPVAGDYIVIQSGNLTWNTNTLPALVGSWTQQAGYTNAVTFQTVYGSTGFTNLTVSGDVILNGGTWTHAGNTGSEANRLRVTVGGNLLITNATITADACGYGSGNGPGYLAGYGTVHGGEAPAWYNSGGAGLGAINPNTYGSIGSPTNLGSGGAGVSGGGAIQLTVAGTTTVASAGTISANGSMGGGGQTAGAGGSIYLRTGWLTGTGTIRANGGDNNWNNGAAASGGRVAIILTQGSDFNLWTGTNVAFGGPHTGYTCAGAAGTVYRQTAVQAAGAGTLIIDNNNIVLPGQFMTPVSSAVNLNAFANVVITRKGNLGVRGDTTLDFTTFAPTTYGPANSIITIDSDTNVTYPATWIIDGYALYANNISTTKLVNVTIGTNGVLAHYQNTSTEAYKLNLMLSGNLLVLSNGTISADGLGYSSGNGPGYLVNASAAYGGAAMGYLSQSVNPKTYGNISAPTNLGSGASYNGGGAILLTVAKTTTVVSAGMISAIGAAGNYGGSGGSVYLTTGWMTGGGTIRANGGSSAWNNGSGGGGGRVAIILTQASDFNLWSGTNSAYGGVNTGGGLPGAAGTVYRQTAGQAAGTGTLIIDNKNNVIAAGLPSTLMPSAPSAVNLNSFSSVVITNKGVLAVSGSTTVDFTTFNPAIYGPANSAIAIDSDTNVTYPATWTIDNCTLYLNAITKTPANVTIGTNGVLSHYQNCTSEAYKLRLSLSGNLVVLSNGAINVDGLGYSSGYGPGYIANYGSAYGGTATADNNGHGGANNLNSNTYGSVFAPTNIGSGGSGSSAGGGGAILLTVAGTTTVATAGLISANGAGGNSSAAGGSVYLRTGWLTGSGTIRADGGGSSWDKGTAGGGGRVAILLSGAGADFGSWTGTNSAYGGVETGGTLLSGAAGTVYRQPAGVAAGAGTVLVNNRTTPTNTTYTPLPAFSNSLENISQSVWVSTNYARLVLTASTNIASLTLNANGFLELRGCALTVKALSVTNKVYKSGTYGPLYTSISVLTDSGSGGKVIVNAGMQGTTLLFR